MWPIESEFRLEPQLWGEVRVSTHVSQMKRIQNLIQNCAKAHFGNGTTMNYVL